MTTQSIAILGTGSMGSRIASRLLSAGYSVTVWNRSSTATKPLAAQGATVASTPKQAAKNADIVISMVTDDEASKAVWFTPETGATVGLKPGTIALESSTLSVAYTQMLAAEIATTGASFLAAPVVGSRPQAEAGSLTYLIGGPSGTLANVHSLLKTTGNVVHYIGDASQAMALKLAVNSLFGIQVAALGESLAFLRNNGISADKAMNCLRGLPIMSPAADGAGTLIVSGNHAPLFPVDLVEKDFRYMLQMAEALNAIMPATTAIHQVYQEAIAQGYGSSNITSVVSLFA